MSHRSQVSLYPGRIISKLYKPNGSLRASKPGALGVVRLGEHLQVKSNGVGPARWGQGHKEGYKYPGDEKETLPFRACPKGSEAARVASLPGV